jgi:acyl-coenzyme A thioesterase PaaI-like protein
MEFYEDGDYIVSNWHPQRNYQGWVNTMHGGILSTLIDEVCGWVVTRKLQTSGYTVQLNVKFKKAIPTTEPLLTISAAAKGVLWKSSSAWPKPASTEN